MMDGMNSRRGEEIMDIGKAECMFVYKFGSEQAATAGCQTHTVNSRSSLGVGGMADGTGRYQLTS